jgi:enoyl-CoA hydratase
VNPVTVERDGAVVTVRIDNVTENASENFLTTPVLTQLWDELTGLERDNGVRAVVLTGADGRFVGHYDVDEILAGAQRVGVGVPRALAPAVLGFAAPLARVRGLRVRLAASPLAGVVALSRFHQLTELIRDSSKVYVAAIDGPAFGGGLELALACDVRVAGAEGCDLGLLEVLLGLVPGGGGSQVLVRALGPQRALDMLLEGRTLTSAQAYELGLVQHLVSREEVLAEARTVARRLGGRFAPAVRAVKHAVHHGGSLSVRRGHAVEGAWFLALAGRGGTQTALRHLATEIWRSRRAGEDPVESATRRMIELQRGDAVEFAAPRKN